MSTPANSPTLRIADAWDGDATLMAQKQARDLGLAVGISSGANLIGAMQLAEGFDDDKAVVTVFSDGNKKCLSTDLCGEEPVRGDCIAPEVELLAFRAVR